MSGTEILGVVASVIQVAELGGRLSVKLCTFCHRFKNANKALQGLSKDVALTCNVLRQLGDSLRQDDLAALYSPDAFGTAIDVLRECESVFQNLERQVEQHYTDPSSKSRIERASKKIWFLMNQPHLDSVAGNLERLKSTMLLMLNVIIYAGQIRSRREASEIQDQRDLLLILANQKLESERNFEKLTKSLQYVNLNTVDSKHQSVFAVDSVCETEDELYHYYKMVKSVLCEIDTVQSFLDSSRYNRVRNGFVGLHTTEASSLQQIYGERAAHLFNDLISGKQSHDLDKAEPKKVPAASTLPTPSTPCAPSNTMRSGAPAPPPVMVPPPPQHVDAFNDLDLNDTTAFNLDFSSLDSDHLNLDIFDFDTFLETEGSDDLSFSRDSTLDRPPAATQDTTADSPFESPRKKSKKRKASGRESDHTEANLPPNSEHDDHQQNKRRLIGPEASKSQSLAEDSSGYANTPCSPAVGLMAASDDFLPKDLEVFVLQWTTLGKSELV